MPQGTPCGARSCPSDLARRPHRATAPRHFVAARHSRPRAVVGVPPRDRRPSTACENVLTLHSRVLAREARPPERPCLAHRQSAPELTRNLSDGARRPLRAVQPTEAACRLACNAPLSDAESEPAQATHARGRSPRALRAAARGLRRFAPRVPATHLRRPLAIRVPPRSRHRVGRSGDPYGKILEILGSDAAMMSEI